MGQTIRIASHTPAPSPHSKVCGLVRLPLESAVLFLKNSNDENLQQERQQQQPLITCAGVLYYKYVCM